MIRPRLVIGFAEAVRRGGDDWRHEFEDSWFCLNQMQSTPDAVDAATMRLCMPGRSFHDIRGRLNGADYEYFARLA